MIKRYSRKHNQDIACLHIRITDKLLALLKTTTKKPSTTNQKTSDNKQPDSKNLPHIDDTPSVNLTDPTINNKGNSPNNNISTVSQDVVNCGEKQKASFKKTVFPIEKEIGERVSEEIKDHIKGMLYNVLKNQGQELKHNERLFTEVLFAVTNKEQFKDVACINHRINIAASLIRKKLWRTPKGFYNHWDIGQAFKERDEVKRRRTSQEKLERELLGVTDPQRIAEIKARFEVSMADETRFDKQKETFAKQKEQISHQRLLSEKLNRISNEIFTEGKYLKQMEEAYQQGLGYANQELIDSIGIKLARLYDEQARIESELQKIRQGWDLCA
ncbi:TPA: hypothetical protein ACWM1T_001765 [Legionella pneumophila]|nr:hypothetical protein [Legionella pneumophila]